MDTPTSRRAACFCVAPPPAGADEAPYDPNVYNPDDPIWQDELWLAAEHVRYGDSSGGAGIGYCTSYKPFELAGNHTRAILMLHAGTPSEPDLLTLADRLALSCECVVLAPLMRGDPAHWPSERLAAEAWAASSYLNGARGAESLAVVAVGATVVPILALLADGALGAHAAVALCPGVGGAGGDAFAAGDSSAADLARVSREVPVPVLAVCATADDGGKAGAAGLRDGLALNSRLASDYYVAELACAPERVLRPGDGGDVKRADEAVALVQSWVDTYCPEGLRPS
jgi:hypothetical protein